MKFIFFQIVQIMKLRPSKMPNETGSLPIRSLQIPLVYAYYDVTFKMSTSKSILFSRQAEVKLNVLLAQLQCRPLVLF